MKFHIAFSLTFILIEFSGANGWKLVWGDDFNGPHIDSNNWGYDLGDGCHLNICGWGNNEQQYYTDSTNNAFIENGHLVISANKENIGNKEYSSARLVSKGKAQWRYGKIEIRAQMPSGQGIWPAIWMLPTNNVHGPWPASGELDIAEVLGQTPSTVHCVAHYGRAYNDKSQKDNAYSLTGGSFADGFHTFQLIWEHDRVEWLVDNNSVLVLTKNDVSPFTYPFNEDFYMVLNVAVGGYWPGNPDHSTQFPARMKVDYVRVYKKD